MDFAVRVDGQSALIRPASARDHCRACYNRKANKPSNPNDVTVYQPSVVVMRLAGTIQSMADSAVADGGPTQELV